MKYLIFGGNGYLAGKLVQKLLQDNNEIKVVVRESADLHYIQHSLKQYGHNCSLLYDTQVKTDDYEWSDWVVNMVCSYGRGGAKDSDIYSANMLYPLEVLQNALESGVQNFLTIGTSLPKNLNMYSFSKHIFGEYGKYYADRSRINFIDIQLEMFYGADEPADRFLPMCIRKMIAGERLEVTEGTQKRDLISAEEVVCILSYVMCQNLQGYHSIPVGTGVAPSIHDVLDYIWQYTGKKSELCFGAIPMRAGEPDCKADVEYLCQLGYTISENWQEGIRSMIDEIKNMEDK